MNTSTVDTSSEKHRLACEARLVMQWNREKRTAYYEGILEARGKGGRKAVDELIAEVKRQYKLREERGAEIGG